MGGKRYFQATLALKAWLELQFRISHELFQRVRKRDQKYKWTQTGLAAKPVSGLFSLLVNFEDILNSETTGKVVFPGFAGPGKTRIRMNSVGTLFPILEANRDEYFPNMWEDPSSLKSELVESELAFVDEVRLEAQAWFTEKGATDGEIELFPRCRLRVENSSEGYWVHLDDAVWSVTDRSAEMLKAVIDAGGRSISISKLGYRSADLKRLPKQIRKLLTAGRGRGTCLAEAAWQS